MRKDDPMKKSIFSLFIVINLIDKILKLSLKRGKIKYLPFQSKNSFILEHWLIFRKSLKLLEEWMLIFLLLKRAISRLKITIAAIIRNVFNETHQY